MEIAVLASDEVKKLYMRLINTNGEVSDKIYLEHAEYLKRLVTFSFAQLENANHRALLNCAEVQYENLTFAGFKSGKTLLVDVNGIGTTYALSPATTVEEMGEQCIASVIATDCQVKLASEFMDSHSAIEAVKVAVNALDNAKRLWKMLLCSKADKKTLEETRIMNRLHNRKRAVTSALKHLEKINRSEMLTNPKLQYGKLFFPVVDCEE